MVQHEVPPTETRFFPCLGRDESFERHIHVFLQAVGRPCAREKRCPKSVFICFFVFAFRFLGSALERLFVLCLCYVVSCCVVANPRASDGNRSGRQCSSRERTYTRQNLQKYTKMNQLSKRNQVNIAGSVRLAFSGDALEIAPCIIVPVTSRCP